ncbi:hypothetical protein [Buttiauxella sp. A111]|uniref:hypothetical protein n=1 Tax=Buttiauxella sp. A111 TaxID=2563088 RepID=UPI0010DAD6AA|nr:hypothetical protein [Buttiauxella sp. A111]GDX06641.1 hypothetical protein BSPA111_28520 [Buttiauxella sp. A111]
MRITIESPGQYYEQVVTELRRRITASVAIVEYDEIWNTEITGPSIVIQFEDAHPGTRQATGRYTHRQIITAHCLIPVSVPKATLTATDLACEVERIIDLNRFGIDPKCVGAPDIQVSGDTSYLFGFDGVVARGVQWIQPLYLGQDYFADEETRGSVWLAMNPKDPDDKNAYSKIFPGDATG